MLASIDLDAAVRSGIITAEQARALAAAPAAPASPRFGDPSAGLPGEEPFRLAGGFNEVFTALGVAALAAGLVVLGGAMGLPLGGLAPAAGLLWLLAELVTRRLRLLLPSIVLCTAIVAYAGFAAAALVPGGRGRAWGVPGLLWGLPAGPALAGFAAAAVAAGLFAWRFRLPFAALPLAGALAGAAACLADLAGLRVALPALLLAAGLAAFAAAMRFDLADPARVRRSSDWAFWLHLAAAPLLAQGAVALLAPGRGLGSGGGAAVILILFAAASLLALVIDRRAPLVAMLSYLGVAVGALLGRAGLSGAGLLALALLIVGALVVVLGIGWRPLRARVLAVVPAPWRARLPAAG